MKRYLYCFFVLALFSVLFAENGYAIPAFARKYKTSCATCHNGFPKLNAFGESFRRNGYQFPGGTDAEFVKDEQVSLGSDGNKKAFPDAIWPGTIPPSSPISLFLNGEMDYNPNIDPRVTFGGLGNSLEAVAAGTLGEDLSFWGQIALSGDGVELNRMFLAFSNILGDNLAFNARLGVFEPGLFSFSTHRAWMEGYWLTTKPFSDDMAWSLEETQKGIELNGLFNGRFGYNVGLVEGFGGAHSEKDVYGHVTYKIDGMPLDGVTANGPALNNPQPYIDNSLTVGAFVYHGNSLLGTDPAAMHGDKFTMGGGDFNAYYERFNLFGGLGLRHDEQPYLGAPGQSANTTVWFTELDYVVFPWLLPGVRYESWTSQDLDPNGGPNISYTDNQFVPGVVALLRPNVKATLRTAIQKIRPTADSKYQFDTVSLGLAVGI